jgi:hypothetical protein
MFSPRSEHSGTSFKSLIVSSSSPGMHNDSENRPLGGFKSFAMAWEDLNKKGMPLARHRARLGLVLRMMISTALTYALATALHQTRAYWAVLTAIIVTQTAVELRVLAAALPSRHPPPDSAAARTAMADFIAAIETIRREGTTRALPTDVLSRILGSAFGVEQLQRDLDDLVERTRAVTIWTR